MREFRQKRGRGEDRFWITWVEGGTVFTRWGRVKDGSRNTYGETNDTPGEKGKVGTKSWVSSEDNAIFRMERAIRKKVEEGYREYGVDGKPLIGGTITREVDFGSVLPKYFCISKPKNSVTEERVKKWDASNELLFTRKVNGMSIIAQVLDGGSIILYSRRMDDVTDKFPQLRDGLKDLQIPARSIMAFEGFFGEGSTKQDFKNFQRVMNSKSERSVQLQKEELGFARFYLYRVPVWKGKEIESENTCEDQIGLIEDTFHDMFLDYTWDDGTPVFEPIEVFGGSLARADEIMKEHGYEGWVVYRKKESFGNMSFSLTGKPDRPSCVFKRKVSYEDDFVAYWDPTGLFHKRCKNGCPFDALSNEAEHCPVCGTELIGAGTFGTGKHEGVVGTLSLYQYTRSGELVYVSEVGTGLSDQDRGDLTSPLIYPATVQVIYNDRAYVSQGDGSNALTFPRVGPLGLRSDKDPTECVNPDLTIECP